MANNFNKVFFFKVIFKIRDSIHFIVPKRICMENRIKNGDIMDISIRKLIKVSKNIQNFDMPSFYVRARRMSKSMHVILKKSICEDYGVESGDFIEIEIKDVIRAGE